MVEEDVHGLNCVVDHFVIADAFFHCPDLGNFKNRRADVKRWRPKLPAKSGFYTRRRSTLRR